LHVAVSSVTQEMVVLAALTSPAGDKLEIPGAAVSLGAVTTGVDTTGFLLA